MALMAYGEAPREGFLMEFNAMVVTSHWVAC